MHGVSLDRRVAIAISTEEGPTGPRVNPGAGWCTSFVQGSF